MAVHPLTLSLDDSSLHAQQALHVCCTVPFSKNLNRNLFGYPFLFRSNGKTFSLEAMDASLHTFCGHVPYTRLVQQKYIDSYSNLLRSPIFCRGCDGCALFERRY